MLAARGVDLNRARGEVRKRQGDAPFPAPEETEIHPEPADARPELENEAEANRAVLQRFTVQALEAMSRAQDEAVRRSDSYVSTLHLLHAILQDDDNIACGLITRLGVSLEQLRAQLEPHLSGTGGGAVKGLSRHVQRAMDLAYEESRRMGTAEIETDHLLVGLIREGHGVAASTLLSFGIDLDTVHREAAAMQSGNAPGKTGAPLPEVSNAPVAPEIDNGQTEDADTDAA